MSSAPPPPPPPPPPSPPPPPPPPPSPPPPPFAQPAYSGAPSTNGAPIPPPPTPPVGSAPPRGLGIPVGFELSSRGKRFGSFLLDGLLFFVTLGIGWLVWDIVLWGRGQSPAKQILHMRVVDLKTGRGATWGPMILRELVGKWLLGSLTSGITTLIGGIMILVDDRYQALWDKIADTIVVDDPNDRLMP